MKLSKLVIVPTQHIVFIVFHKHEYKIQTTKKIEIEIVSKNKKAIPDTRCILHFSRWNLSEMWEALALSRTHFYIIIIIQNKYLWSVSVVSFSINHSCSHSHSHSHCSAVRLPIHVGRCSLFSFFPFFFVWFYSIYFGMGDIDSHENWIFLI